MKNITIKHFKLPNGFSVILEPMSFINSVVLSITVGAGSRYETEESTGLAHFFEHMLFEGTNRFPSPKQLAEYIENIGGKNGAWTDKEYTIYYVKVPTEYLEIALDYLSDLIFHSVFNAENIQKEKGIIIEEINQSKDNPESGIWDLWMEWVWGKKQSLGRPTLGYETSVRDINKPKLTKYFEKLYYPANMVISIAGNFSLNEAKHYVFKYFNKNKNEQTSNFKKAIFTPKQIKTKIITTNANQNQLILGFVTNISYDHKDRFPMQIVANILSTGINSRLFYKLVYKLGLAYSVNAESLLFFDTGLFYVYGGFSIENTKNAIKIILDELNQLKEKKVSSIELNGAKIKAKSIINFLYETPDAISNSHAIQQITEGRILTIEDMSNYIDKVSPVDIQRVARKYLDPQNLCLVIKGPIKETQTKNIEEILKKFNKNYVK